MFLLDIINFNFILSFVLGIKGGESCRFFKGTIREFLPLCLDDDVRAGGSFCMEPPVISGGKFKGQFIVLIIVFTNIDMKSVIWNPSLPRLISQCRRMIWYRSKKN